MLKSYLIAFAAGIVAALFFAIAGSNFFLAMLVLPFSAVPLFLVGFSQGYRMVFVAGGAAAVLCGMFFGSFSFSLVYLVILLAPAALATRYALLNRTLPDGTVEWYPAGRLITIVVAYMVVLFLALAGIFSGSEGGLLGLATEQIILMYGGQFEALPVPDGETPDEAIGSLAYNAVTWTPGMAVVFMVISMALAQLIVRKLGKALRISFDLIDLQLPRGLAYGFVVAIAASLVGPGQLGFIATGVAVALATPYFFLGIVVAHSIARRFAAGVIALAIMYALLFFAQPFSMMALAALGLAEQWIFLRRRFGSGGGPGTGGPSQNLTRQE